MFYGAHLLLLHLFGTNKLQFWIVEAKLEIQASAVSEEMLCLSPRSIQWEVASCNAHACDMLEVCLWFPCGMPVVWAARWNRSTPRDFTKQERAEVGTYLTRDGCHHCGAKPSLDQ